MRVTGDKELIKLLNAIKTTKAKAAIRKGSRAGSYVVLPHVKAAAPRRTGKLESTLKVRALPRSRRWTGTMIRSSMFYSIFLEYGTKSKSGAEKIKARKFIRNAFNAAQTSALHEFIDVAKQEIFR